MVKRVSLPARIFSEPSTRKRALTTPEKLYLPYIYLLTLLTGILLLPSQQGVAAPLENTASKTIYQPVTTTDNATIANMMAGLSDEQVRKLLIQELQKDAQPLLPEGKKIKGPGSLFHHILKALSQKHDQEESQFRTLWTGAPNILPDLENVFIKLCPFGTVRGAVQSALWVFLFISIGFVVEAVFRYLFISKYFIAAPEVDTTIIKGVEKLFAAVLQVLPNMLGLLIFFGAAYFSFMFFIWTDSPYVQFFFLATLITITIIRIINILSLIIFSPQYKIFRVFPADCGAAKTAHRLMTGAFSYITITLMLAVTLRRLDADIATVRLLQLFSVSLLLFTTAAAIVVIRKNIREHILANSNHQDGHPSWGRKQFAALWHILAITYLILLWFLLLNDLADPSYSRRGAFIPSFFIFPLWIVADRLVQWLVLYTMKTLHLHQDGDLLGPQKTDEEILQHHNGLELYQKIKTVARIGLVVLMMVWIANLWDIRIPLFSELAAILLDTIVIMALAIFMWQLISSWIERKIEESLPEGEEDVENNDDEWGSAASRGRAYTLLPMVRKFIGTILIVMVTMTVLSSSGVDIAPLLAGAGVIGLAIGFGAQKLVADMFSGFFYLLDDAFRVGEYIEASTVSGTVETITLRNAMIRHHRGMLQIVPHSDLGAITNYMRGGIIVKFNLDFPYDAPIDKIRKIIKKVGLKMLQNEEYGKDFLRPLKSQGVRAITNSVMTIRVKFTAQPGTHFVIRREAFRLITEALTVQGIQYAHRKVIVDLPEFTQEREQITPEDQHNISKAAGAAAMRSAEDIEKEPQQSKQDTFDDL